MTRPAAWVAALAVAVLAATRLAGVARDQLAAPFDLVSEGPHLSAVLAIRDGVDVFDPAMYRRPPFTLTPYAPLYHVIVAALPQEPANPFFTGRVVAAVSMLAAAAAMLALGLRHGQAPLAVAFVGLFFLVPTVTGNTAYLRSDNLALAFAAWAVVTAAATLPGRGGEAAVALPARRGPAAVALPARAGTGADAFARRGRAAAGAGVLAALAIAGKQSFTAPAVAGFVGLLLHDRRLALRFAVAGAVTGAVLALAASLMWGRGFWFCMALPLTSYPRQWGSVWQRVSFVLAQPVVLYLLALAGVGLILTATRRAWTPVRALLGLYMAAAWALQMGVMTGIGAAEHNLIEPVLATVLWIVVAVDARRGLVPAALCATAALAALVELRTAPLELYAYTTPEATAEHLRQRDQARRAIDSLGLPGRRFLNLENSQVTHDFPGAVTVNDPFMFVMLWDTGTVSTAPLLDAIRARAFDAVLLAPSLTSAANQRPEIPTQNVILTAFQYYRPAFRNELVSVLVRSESP